MTDDGNRVRTDTSSMRRPRWFVGPLDGMLTGMLILTVAGAAGGGLVALAVRLFGAIPADETVSEFARRLSYGSALWGAIVGMFGGLVVGGIRGRRLARARTPAFRVEPNDRPGQDQTK